LMSNADSAEKAQLAETRVAQLEISVQQRDGARVHLDLKGDAKDTADKVTQLKASAAAMRSTETELKGHAEEHRSLTERCARLERELGIAQSALKIEQATTELSARELARAKTEFDSAAVFLEQKVASLTRHLSVATSATDAAIMAAAKAKEQLGDLQVAEAQAHAKSGEVAAELRVAAIKAKELQMQHDDHVAQLVEEATVASKRDQDNEHRIADFEVSVQEKDTLITKLIASKSEFVAQVSELEDELGKVLASKAESAEKSQIAETQATMLGDRVAELEASVQQRDAALMQAAAAFAAETKKVAQLSASKAASAEKAQALEADANALSDKVSELEALVEEKGGALAQLAEA